MLVTLINPYTEVASPVKSTFSLNVTHFTALNRKSILNNLIKDNKISQKMSQYNLVTSHPRNYLIDILLLKNQDLYYDEDQTQQDFRKNKRIIQLPITLEIIIPNEQYLIDCQSQDITIDYLNIIQKIGQGTYAQIFLVQTKYNRTLYSMKRINKAECRQKGSLNMIKNQFEVLQYPSKYKVKMFYQFEDKTYVYFILEYCPFGDLNSIIRNNKLNQQSFKLTLTDKYSIWIQIALGIASLHQKGIIYRDIKPENILLNENAQIKICDFGFACQIKDKQKLTELCGSYEYLAPEMIKKQGYGFSLDIYCLGLLLYEILVDSNPFQGIKPQNLTQMKNKSINFDRKSISSNSKDLLRKILKDKPEQRLGYDSSLQIFKHSFFKQNQDIVIKIVQDKVAIKNVRYVPPLNLNLRVEQHKQNVPFVFPQGIAFNYLKPFFNVTENVGPKFNFTK